MDKEGVHSKLMDYFDAIPKQEKIESADDLASVIELYHHTVRAGRYDKAYYLYQYRLSEQLYYTLGAYQTEIELLRALFPDGGDNPPRLKKEDAQAWTLNALATSYALSGQPRRAVPLFEMQIAIREKHGNKKNLAIGLANLAQLVQIRIGKFDAAESNLMRSIKLIREIKDKLKEAFVLQDLGRLLAYQGKFEESEKELANAIDTFEKLNYDYAETAWTRRSLCSILMNNADKAMNHAKKARELGEKGGHVGKLEAEIIHAEYLLGAAHLMKGNIVEVEKHLTEALTRDRKINLIELEPDILLELAKLRLEQNHKEEALKFADEALQIADRCEYRLKQADIHNFLAEFYLDADDLEKAKKHGEIAKERAACGYKPALEKAEKLLNEIELR